MKHGNNESVVKRVGNAVAASFFLLIKIKNIGG